MINEGGNEWMLCSVKVVMNECCDQWLVMNICFDQLTWMKVVINKFWDQWRWLKVVMNERCNQLRWMKVVTKDWMLWSIKLWSVKLNEDHDGWMRWSRWWWMKHWEPWWPEGMMNKKLMWPVQAVMYGERDAWMSWMDVMNGYDEWMSWQRLCWRP